jgi:phage gp37-like protein
MDLSAIEQAIKDKIKALGRPYVKEIKTYGGEFDDDLGLDQVVQMFPAIWVTFSGSGTPQPLGSTRTKIPLTFTVLVGARGIRNEESAREGIVMNGEIISVGSFQLIKDVCIAIANKDFGLMIDPMRPGKISTIFNTKTKAEAVSVLAMDWTTYVVLDANDDDADAADWLEKVSLNYVLKPHEVASVSDEVILTN